MALVTALTLNKIPAGSFAQITQVNVCGAKRRRLQDLGLVPGTLVEVIRRSPAGDPTAYRIRGAIIALRQEDSSQITVR